MSCGLAQGEAHAGDAMARAESVTAQALRNAFMENPFFGCSGRTDATARRWTGLVEMGFEGAVGQAAADPAELARRGVAAEGAGFDERGEPVRRDETRL
jgi:hypothetical protein